MPHSMRLSPCHPLAVLSQLYATIVVIVWGIAVTFRTELRFCWGAILIAMVTNTIISLQAIYFKKAVVSPKGE